MNFLFIFYLFLIHNFLKSEGLDKGSPEAVHGSLLSIRELLTQTGNVDFFFFFQKRSFFFF